jgi:ubiquinone biosynthesis protein COQ4
MKDNQLNMDDRAIVTYINDYDLAYVYQRYKEIHDFLHVIF